MAGQRDASRTIVVVSARDAARSPTPPHHTNQRLIDDARLVIHRPTATATEPVDDLDAAHRPPRLKRKVKSRRKPILDPNSRISRISVKGVTFAFVCVDKGPARATIFDLLIGLKIPFIDAGMGLNRKRGALAGTLRATYYSADNAAQVRELRLADEADEPDDIYRRNVQIAELNALNAALAIIRYKQLLHFYVDDNAFYHLLMSIEDLHTFGVAS